MPPDHASAAQHMLAAARAGRLSDAGLAAFGDYDPQDKASGLAVQLSVLQLREAAGERLAGWKIGLTSRGGRDSMGEGFRPFGYVLASRVLPDGGTLDTDGAGNFWLEPEIGLTLRAPLRGEVTLDEARAAVGSLHASFEILQRRVPPQAKLPVIRLADGLGQWGIVHGPAQPATLAATLDGAPVELTHDGTLTDSGRIGPAVLDDPVVSLVRVTRELAARGRGLAEGQRLITGSLLEPVHATPGTWTATLGPLGPVSLTVQPT